MCLITGVCNTKTEPKMPHVYSNNIHGFTRYSNKAIVCTYVKLQGNVQDCVYTVLNVSINVLRPTSDIKC